MKVTLKYSVTSHTKRILSLENHSMCGSLYTCGVLGVAFGLAFRLEGGVGMHESGSTPDVKQPGNFFDITFMPRKYIYTFMNLRGEREFIQNYTCLLSSSK